MILYAPDSSHWYQADGTAMHTILSAKGEPRPTTLRDARKLNLLPSVTNILGIIAKPELTGWLQEQAVLASLTLPRIAGETEDAFARRVVEDSKTTRDMAADFGTAFHAGAEAVVHGVPVKDGPQAEWLHHYAAWVQANVIRVLWTESALVGSSPGYAGCADLLIEHQAYGLTLCDLKTQRVRAGEKPKAYKSWAYQLAAYQKAAKLNCRCLNIMIPSVAPGEPVEHLWEEAEIERGWEAFKAAHKLWSIEKNYEPA